MKKSLNPTAHAKGLKPWNKLVLQNKPIAFRPKDDVKKFLKELDQTDQNLSKHINRALRLLEQYRKDPTALMKDLKRKHSLDFHYVNRNAFY